MKKIIILSALVIAVSASAFAAKPANSVKVVSKANDVVYFKVSCEMIGATIEVKNANGDVIFTSKVKEKKVIVDFYAEPSGEYTVEVKKDENITKIDFNKSTDSQAAQNYVIIAQM